MSIVMGLLRRFSEWSDMNKMKSIFLIVLLTLSSCSSNNELEIQTTEITPSDSTYLNLLTDVDPMHEDGNVNAIIEIPAGTIQKWEMNKSTGEIEWEIENDKPRSVNYIGYPGNYGMIPKTLLPKEDGGDGDPLDVIVLGSSIHREEIVKCKVIGVLYLEDRGEQDDKLIAVPYFSPMYDVNSIKDLNAEYQGVTKIIETWFTNYKGPDKMKSNGFGEKSEALLILQKAIEAYQ